MKAVTDTKYYDEIAYNIGIYGKSGLKPHEMADEIVKIARDRERYGREAERNDFWEIFQNGGVGNKSYTYAFAYKRFTDANYFPKYPIQLSGDSGYFMFAESGITSTKVPIIAEGSDIRGCFRWDGSLKEIVQLVVNENTRLDDAFYQCGGLEYIRFSGTIGCSVSFAQSSKLTSASVDSIIGALKPLTTDDGAKTLTLHATVKANMTDTQKAIIAEKKWSLA